MKAYIDDAHRRGFKVKIYNTIRELSNHAPEIFALRSLAPRSFPRPGGGYSWLQEHLGSDYIRPGLFRISRTPLSSIADVALAQLLY